jgi:hypothetical protein
MVWGLGNANKKSRVRVHQSGFSVSDSWVRIQRSGKKVLDFGFEFYHPLCTFIPHQQVRLANEETGLSLNPEP